MINLFNAEWFKRHQLMLLLAVNNPIPNYRESIREKLGLTKYPSNLVIKEVYPYGCKLRLDKYYDAYSLHSKSPIAKKLMKEYYELWRLIHNFDMKFANRFVPALNMGFDTFYELHSDANPETTTVDGYMQSGTGSAVYTFLQMLNNDTSQGVGDTQTYSFAGLSANSSYVAPDKYWNYLMRSIHLFDLSSVIGAIQTATLTITPYEVGSYTSFNQTYGITEAATVSNTAISSTDTTNHSNRDLRTRFASDKGHGAFANNTPATYTLNSTGLAYLTGKIGSIAKLGIKASGDIDQVRPTWQSAAWDRIKFYTADNGSMIPELYLLMPSDNNGRNGGGSQINVHY